MSELKKDIIEFLKVLADQTRLDILYLLYRGKKSSSEIQSALNKSQPTISQHLKVLDSKNLIIFERIKNENDIPVKYYKIKNKGIFEILVNIKSFVDGTNKERLHTISDEDIIDTLLT